MSSRKLQAEHSKLNNGTKESVQKGKDKSYCFAYTKEDPPD